MDRGRAQNLLILFKAGDYFIDKTVHFGKEDSGTDDHPVIYKNWSAKGSAHLIGGRVLTEWTEAGGGIYSTQLDDDAYAIYEISISVFSETAVLSCSRERSVPLVKVNISIGPYRKYLWSIAFIRKFQDQRPHQRQLLAENLVRLVRLAGHVDVALFSAALFPNVDDQCRAASGPTAAGTGRETKEVVADREVGRLAMKVRDAHCVHDGGPLGAAFTVGQRSHWRSLPDDARIYGRIGQLPATPMRAGKLGSLRQTGMPGSTLTLRRFLP